MRIAKEKISSGSVRWHLGDIFQYRSDRLYDTVFFSFSLSHVPLDRFDGFWALVDQCLRPRGRVFFIDNAHPELAITSTPEPSGATSGAERNSVRGVDSVTDVETGIAKRVAADGRSYELVKIWWGPEELRTRLAQLGWDVRPTTTQGAFIYGTVKRMDEPVDQ